MAGRRSCRPPTTTTTGCCSAAGAPARLSPTGCARVTTWTLVPTTDGTATRLKLSTTWQGRGGVGGFFERTFAPKGLRRIYDDLLDRLTEKVRTAPGS